MFYAFKERSRRELEFGPPPAEAGVCEEAARAVLDLH